LFFQQNEAAKSPFAAFGGFKATSNNSSSAFSFTKANKPSDTANSSASKNMKTDSIDVTSGSKSAEYYANLKGLNQCVSQWIKSHVDSNPFCILTPIFKDYERHLAEIDEKESKQQLGKEADMTQRRVKSPATRGIMTEWCVYLYAAIDMSRVGIATGYEFDDRGVRIKSPSRVKNLSMSRPVLGHTQPPIQWVLGDLSSGVKQPELEADHSPPNSAEIKKPLIYTFPHMSSWCSA
jgi:hypothetical protein